MKRTAIIISLFVACLLLPVRAHGISFALDSIATWGKFPRFVVNTYRWGDQFFNGYDTTYVVGTGYKWNAKVALDSWVDGYRFVLPNNTQIHMNSDPSTSIGAYLTYLAVSVGYDVNLSQLFTGNHNSRKRWRFGFNCMLFAAEAYLIRNDVGTTIKRFGDNNYNIPFQGIDNTTWGIDAYYFFNHKRYSEAAAFNFSRIQKRSQGAFYTGFSIYTQKLDFDFRSLPPELQAKLPASWKDYSYSVDTHNYAIRFGYGYNWVFHPGWVIGISESPIVGIRSGYINSKYKKLSFSMYNRAKLSVIWNHGRLFAGAVGKFDAAIINDHETTYAGGVLSGEAIFGCRFNLW